LTALAKGQVEVSIRDKSAMSLAAFVVTVSQAPGSDASSNPSFVFYSDPLIDAASRPLLASEDRVILRGADRRRVLEEPIDAAGILADGTTIGEAALLTRLMLRRSNMLPAVERTLEALSMLADKMCPETD
jgi:hypothetical protein